MTGLMDGQTIIALDRQLTLAINSWNSPLSDSIMVFLSDKFVWIPMYLLIAAFLFWRLKWEKALIALVAIGLTFLFCEQISNLVKFHVARIRPLNDEAMLLGGLHVLEHGGGFSFFSAHAANTFGLATCSSMLLRKDKSKFTKGYMVWIFLWAFSVSVSRIFVGRHFFGDVLVGTVTGILLGWFFGLLGHLFAEKIVR